MRHAIAAPALGALSALTLIAGCSGTREGLAQPDEPARAAYRLGDPGGYHRANVEWIVDEDFVLEALANAQKVPELRERDIVVWARRATEYGADTFTLHGECPRGCVAIPVPTQNGFVFWCDCRPKPIEGIDPPAGLSRDFACLLEIDPDARGLDAFRCLRGLSCRDTCQLSYVWDPDWDAFVMACLCVE